jgi:DNA-directed RNA polymerase subunit M/transcription elongation factor TFIIS
MPPRKTKQTAAAAAVAATTFENTFATTTDDSRKRVLDKWKALYSRLADFSSVQNATELIVYWAERTELGAWELTMREWRKKQGFDPEGTSLPEENWTHDRDFWNLYILQNVYLFQNIDSQGAYGNPHLWNQIRNQELDPYMVASMNPMERFPARWEQVSAALEATDKFLYHSEEVASDAFRCMRCKQRKCTYTQAQLRASDEPMTTLIKCLNCGHNWRS